MKSTLAAASTLLALAAAMPQGGPPNGWSHGGGAPGIFANFPSCVNSCWQQIQSSGCSLGDYSCYCAADTISSANACVESSDCSQSDKDATYKAVAQLCANAGASVTAKPEATWSVTSGGSAWPTTWTTNSAWPSGANGPWGPGGPGGWNGPGAGNWGPFGHGGNHGWGNWGSSGAWTDGPWTSWWGGSACPASTWSGWTSGPWGTNAPWTTWSGCSATTTATSVVTTTATGNGTVYTTTATQYGIQVAEATNGGGSNGGAAASSSTSPGAAMATNFRLAGSAAGFVGVVAGALLL